LSTSKDIYIWYFVQCKLRCSPVFYEGVAYLFNTNNIMLIIVVLCVMFCITLVVLFVLVIVLSVLLRFTASDYLYGIFKLLNVHLVPITKLWGRTPSWRGILDTTLYDNVCQWLATGRWFSPGTPVSSTNKTDRHDITEIVSYISNDMHIYYMRDNQMF
jgi:hypothetical protein